MKPMWLTLLSTMVVIVSGASTSYATIRIVSNASELQSALNVAVAGDEIVLKDGIYTGQFTITGNSGTASSPITMRPENLHQAILENAAGCSSQAGLTVSRNFWVIQGLRFRNHHDGIRVNTTNGVTIRENIIENFGQHGVRVVTGVESILIEKNVIGHGATCTGSNEGVGIVFINTGGTRGVNNSTIRENIVFATGDNGYTFGSKYGYGILIANNSSDNLVQGNLLFANGGKGVLRFLSGSTADLPVERNKVYDNAILWGEGENSSNSCLDDSHEFVNNIMYGHYQFLWNTKGNYDGTKGNHLLKHNLFYTDAFSRTGATLGTGGQPECPNSAGIDYKIQNTVQDNIFYSPDRQSDFHRTWLVWGQSGFPSAIKKSGLNLFWAPGTNPADWVMNYTYQSTDIRDPNRPPLFTNPAEGDFSLMLGSPGKNAGSDGKDIGIEYNSYLKKSWLKNAFTLSTQQKENLGTSTSFTVNPVKYYQVWFYIPESSPYQGVETFNVEGQSLQRDIKGLAYGNIWVQPGGPSRWITLGRHRATDGTLNVSWSNSASASKIFIRELPTADEAYSWITGATVPPPPPPPPPSPSLAVPGRIEAESFNTGGEGVAYHDTTSANLGGAYRIGEAVDIKVAPGGTGHTIGYIQAGEWLKYDVNVAQSGDYTIALRAANGATTNGALHLEVDGVNATGIIVIPPTGSYSNEITIAGPTVSLTQGAHTLLVYMEAPDFDLNWLEFTSSSTGSALAAPGGLVVESQ